jgi:hypothetical integral membrane protein (TIGR02206 family)
MKMFGMAHLAILAGIAVLAAVLLWASVLDRAAARAVRWALGISLIVNELVWYGFRYSQEGFRFPEGLPLELCDLVVWLTALACLRLNTSATEFIYFAGMGGSVMALLTPDLWAPLFSYPTFYFFAGHGLVVIAAIVLVFGREVRMRRGCVWRVFAWLNLYAAAIGIFDLYFYTNYFYLCDKPAGSSILDWFGPWPVYIGVAELFALALFGIIWLPVRLWVVQRSRGDKCEIAPGRHFCFLR